MKNRSTRALLAVNGALLALVVAVAVAPGFGPAQPERARGAYTMVSGAIQGGGNSDVVYLLDSANQELIALGWNNAKNDVEVIGYRNLPADAKQRGAR